MTDRDDDIYRQETSRPDLPTGYEVSAAMSVQINIYLRHFLEFFYRKEAAAFHRFFFAKTGNRNDADDLMQETFKRFLEGIDNYRRGRDIVHYLRGIARNVLKEYYKERKETPSFEPDLSDILDPKDHAIQEFTSYDEILYLAKRSRLSRFQTDVFCLKIMFGCKPRESAWILKEDPIRVRRELNRAIGKVKEYLDRSHYKL